MDGDRARIVQYLCESTRPGDLVLTLGAGDVGQLGAEFLARLDDGAEGQNRR
jgi:UDP-N-acetylmuramate-alanine ligase